VPAGAEFALVGLASIVGSIDLTIREPKVGQQLGGISRGGKEQLLDFAQRH
jgi:hypothetical protein